MAYQFKRKLWLGLCATAFVFGEAVAEQGANIMQAKIEPFVDAKVLADFTLDKYSQLTLSNQRFITGKTSLEWNWSAGSQIIFHRPYYVPSDREAQAAWGRRATPLFSFFIYNETPIEDYLVVDLGTGVNLYNRGDAGLRVKLNFTGWRAVGVSLNNDIEYRYEFDNSDDSPSVSKAKSLGDHFNSVKFIAPKSVKQGRFFIDHIMLSVDDIRYQWSDYHVKTRMSEPEISYQLVPLPKISPQILQQDLKLIEQRFTDLLLNARDPRFNENIDMDYLRQTFASFEIKKSKEGVISGRHVLTDKQRDRYQVKFLSEQDKALFDQYLDLNAYGALMYNIARAYQKSSNPADKQQLASMYLLLTEHLIDQGFTQGSSLITTHHWGYSSRWWYLSAFLMRDVLSQAQLKQRVADALLWYAREFKTSFEMILTPDSSDLDYFNTLARQHLALLLLESDPEQQLKLVNSYANYLAKAIAQTPPGTKDGLRPDGTAWRHDGHYPGYAYPAFPNMALLAYLFKGTAFAFDETAFNQLKKALVSAWIYSNPNTAIGISGRLPFKTESIAQIADSYYWLALASNTEAVDPELAGIYLALTGKSSQEGLALFKQAIAPANLPQGFWAFNGGAFGIHRYKDKMVTLKTYNSNVWSSEIYFEENRYGRYQSNGSAQILLHKSPEEQGYREQGWDWNRLPGVTAIHLPWDKLNSPITHTLMLRGETPYNGTSSLLQQYGMMKSYLREPSGMRNFDSGFSAKKTVLAAGDHLIMVGTEIKSSDNNQNVETTLFQLATEQSGEALLNGNKVRSATELAFKTGDWLIDGNGNGYLITQVQAGKVANGKQQSIQGTPDQRYVGMERKATEGQFSTAWIDHSAQGNNADYEYMVFLDASPAKMQALANQVKNGTKPYQFEAQPNAHIIRDQLSQVTGYAFYQAGAVDDDLLISADQPSIIMSQQQGDRLTISGVTPNLNITGGKRPKPIEVKVVIKGRWQALETNPAVKVKVAGNNTQLSFSSYFGIPQEVSLKAQ